MWVGQNDLSSYNELVILVQSQLEACELFQTTQEKTWRTRKSAPAPRSRTLRNYKRTVIGRKDAKEQPEARKEPGDLGKEGWEGKPNSPRQRASSEGKVSVL